MNPDRVRQFERDHPSETFPRVSHLSEQEGAQIRNSLARRIGLEAGVDPLVLTRELRRRSQRLQGINAEASFDLNTAFHAAHIRPAQQVLLNWHRFDEISGMALEDVIARFDYLWYPSADDLDLFDHSLAWLLSVTYQGDIYVLRLG
jgi:hypothetical protein